MEATDRLIANPDVLLREEFDNWGVLFNSVTGDSLATGPVGVAVWKALDGRHTVADIASEVRVQFEATPDSVLDDILAFGESLCQRRFAAPAQDGGGA